MPLYIFSAISILNLLYIVAIIKIFSGIIIAGKDSIYVLIVIIIFLSGSRRTTRQSLAWILRPAKP